MTPGTTENPPSAEIISADSWMDILHDPILPSGAHVVYRDVSLSELVMLDELPDDLRAIAVLEWNRPGAASDLAAQPLRDIPDKATKKQKEKAAADSQSVCEQIAQVNRYLIALALVQPQMTVEQLAKIPIPDLEMLSALISRKISHDAVGRRVGVVPLDWFRTVTAAHGIECASGCEACKTAGRALSTVQRR